MIHAVIYVGGVASSRFFLLFLGTLISHYIGSNSYSDFVLFLALSNVLINYSLTGFIPRILALPACKIDPKELNIIIGGAGYILLIFIVVGFSYPFWESYFGGEKGIDIGCFEALFYSAGFILISIVSSFLNRKEHHHLGGFLWFFVSFCSFSITAISVTIEKKLPLFTYSVVWAMAGLLALAALIFYHFDFIKMLKHTFKTKDILYASSKIMSSSMFGLPLLLVFFIFGLIVNNQTAESAAYFLGFQLYTIATFLPGVLGAIIVPKLTKMKACEKKTVWRFLTKIYLAAGAVWVLSIWFLLPFLLPIYGIERSMNVEIIVLLWQGAGLCAAIGAINIQLFVAQNKYGTLLAGSILWAISGLAAALLLTSFTSKALSAVSGVLFAYLILQLFYWLKEKKITA